MAIMSINAPWKIETAHHPMVDAPVLEARHAAKSFGATLALVDGNIVVRRGEVLALLGENGSGKSTLVKLLSGVLRPDTGEIFMDGHPVDLPTPHAATRTGVVTVFQEILIAPDRSILDNLWLGNGSAADTRRNRRRQREAATELLAELSPGFPPLDTPVSKLDLMQRQLCVVARALLHHPRVLVLDEATSTLDVTLRDRVFEKVRDLCSNGMAAIFISHRMEEVLSLADRFVALRSGRTIGELGKEDVDATSLLTMISGKDEMVPASTARTASARDGTTAIRLHDVVVRDGSRPFSLDIGRGEIFGLAGLEGHGQDELLQAMAGLHTLPGGSIEYLDDGIAHQYRDYGTATRNGISYVPRDRRVDGIAENLSAIDNYALPIYQEDSVGPVINLRKTKQRFVRDSAVVNFVIGSQPTAGRLSGGNQQKLLLARWLATKPRVLLLNDPTRGVDLKTKRELYELFRSLAQQGVTIVLLSTEVEELTGLCDRIAVFHTWSFSAVLEGDEIQRDHLLNAYFGRYTSPCAALSTEPSSSSTSSSTSTSLPPLAPELDLASEGGVVR
jgi:ABC-type sugar transport system ATPase subunit